MNKNIQSFCVGLESTLQDTIAKMNKNRMGVILVIDKDKRLLGTITDGDVRRAFLANFALLSSVTMVLEHKSNTQYATPLVAFDGQDKTVYLELLKTSRLSHLPILNEKKQVVGLVSSDDFVMESCSSLKAMVMAGGRGARLYPLTEDLPKPMLRVGDKPLLEIIIDQLKSLGIKNINVTMHHKSEKITEHFGNGDNFGVKLDYISENRPLGTAGALGLIKPGDETLLVINGDILTQVDFKAMHQFHREHEADLTVAVRKYDFQVPYGVIECDGPQVLYLKEKPVYSFFVNAGIYLLEPVVKQYIPKSERYDMTDLIQNLVSAGRRVISFPVHECWLDIGEHSDYNKAQEEAGKFVSQGSS